MNIEISGSSFLLNNNFHWNKLADNFDLKFSDVGNWHLSFINSNADFLVQVIIIEDLIEDIQNTKKKIKLLIIFLSY